MPDTELTTATEEVLDHDETAEKTVYEVAFLLDSALSDDDAASKQDSFISFIEEREGEIISAGSPESRKLAYTITVKRDTKRKDYTKAYFSWIKFDMATESVSEVEKMLKADEKIVRFLMVKTLREDTLRDTSEGDMFAENDEELDAAAPASSEPAPETRIEKSNDVNTDQAE